VIFGVLSSWTGVNGGVRALLQLEQGGVDPWLTGEGGAATSASKPTGRGTMSGAREASRALSEVGGCEGARARAKGTKKSGMRRRRHLQIGRRAGEE
jgi:hypothetical protein